MTPAPQCEVLETLAAGEAVAAEWDELADAVGARPLVRAAYCLSWWRRLGPGRLLLRNHRPRRVQQLPSRAPCRRPADGNGRLRPRHLHNRGGALPTIDCKWCN